MRPLTALGRLVGIDLAPLRRIEVFGVVILVQRAGWPGRRGLDAAAAARQITQERTRVLQWRVFGCGLPRLLHRHLSGRPRPTGGINRFFAQCRITRDMLCRMPEQCSNQHVGAWGRARVMRQTWRLPVRRASLLGFSQETRCPGSGLSRRRVAQAAALSRSRKISRRCSIWRCSTGSFETERSSVRSVTAF